MKLLAGLNQATLYLAEFVSDYLTTRAVLLLVHLKGHLVKVSVELSALPDLLLVLIRLALPRVGFAHVATEGCRGRIENITFRAIFALELLGLMEGALGRLGPFNGLHFPLYPCRGFGSVGCS